MRSIKLTPNWIKLWLIQKIRYIHLPEASCVIFFLLASPFAPRTHVCEHLWEALCHYVKSRTCVHVSILYENSGDKHKVTATTTTIRHWMWSKPIKLPDRSQTHKIIRVCVRVQTTSVLSAHFFLFISQFVLVDGHGKQIKSQINEWYWEKNNVSHSLYLAFCLHFWICVCRECAHEKNNQIFVITNIGGNRWDRTVYDATIVRGVYTGFLVVVVAVAVFSSTFFFFRCTAWNIEMTQWAGPLPPVSEKKHTHRRKAIIPLLFIRCLRCHILRLCYDPDRVNVFVADSRVRNRIGVYWSADMR